MKADKLSHQNAIPSNLLEMPLSTFSGSSASRLSAGKHIGSFSQIMVPDSVC
jgi:hypothetical protein